MAEVPDRAPHRSRSVRLGPARHPERRRPETAAPIERAGIARWRLTIGYVLAVVAPVAVAVAAIPFRESHQGAVTIALVLPVVLVAGLGATGPAVVAALVAAVSYGVMLTRPYYHVVIDDSDDFIAAVALGVVGIAVGMLSGQVSRLRTSDEARRRELRCFVGFSTAAAHVASLDELAEAACLALVDLLGLDGCRWHGGYHGTVAPTLHASGDLTGHAADLRSDRGRLPHHLELPAIWRGIEFGRFVLTSTNERLVSREERVTAAAIASLFADLSRQFHDVEDHPQ